MAQEEQHAQQVQAVVDRLLECLQGTPLGLGGSALVHLLGITVGEIAWQKAKTLQGEDFERALGEVVDGVAEQILLTALRWMALRGSARIDDTVN